MSRFPRSRWFLVTIFLLAASGLVALAQQGPGGPGGPPPGRGGPRGEAGLMGPLGTILRSIELSADQREQIRSHVDKAREGDLGRIVREQVQSRFALMQLIYDPAADEAAITAAAREVAAKVEAMALPQHQLSMDVLEVLTPEQREQVRKRLADRKPRGGPQEAPPPPPDEE